MKVYSYKSLIWWCAAGYRYSASRNMYHDPTTGFFFDIASQVLAMEFAT